MANQEYKSTKLYKQSYVNKEKTKSKCGYFITSSKESYNAMIDNHTIEAFLSLIVLMALTFYVQHI